MTLLEYFNHIKKMIKDHPEYKNLPVTYSADDEGNSYHMIINSPSPWKYEKLDDYYLETADEEDTSYKANAIIIN